MTFRLMGLDSRPQSNAVSHDYYSHHMSSSLTSCNTRHSLPFVARRAETSQTSEGPVEPSAVCNLGADHEQGKHTKTLKKQGGQENTHRTLKIASHRARFRPSRSVKKRMRSVHWTAVPICIWSSSHSRNDRAIKGSVRM